MKSTLRPAFVLFAALTLICCVLYPFAMTGIGQTAFAEQAAGSLVERKGQALGSTLIGQAFSSPKYFWGVHPLPARCQITQPPPAAPTSARPILPSSTQ